MTTDKTRICLVLGSIFELVLCNDFKTHSFYNLFHSARMDWKELENYLLCIS